MKLLKYFSFAALSLCMVACSDDDTVLNTATGVSVNFGKEAMSVNEDNAGNEVSINLPINITGDANGPVRVTVEFAPVGENGAVEDVDYIATSKVINISEEDKTANIEIYTVPNTVEDDTKSFTVTITAADGANIGESYVSTITLLDNDVVIPSEWEDLGMCTFTEPYFSNLYFSNPVTVSYKVQLQRNAEDASEYRLVDPYGEAFANALAKAYAPGEEEDFIAEMEADCDIFYVKDTEEHHYLYFYLMDVSEEEGVQTLDADGVYIPSQYLPLDWGDGQIMALSYGYYDLAYSGIEYATSKANGHFGTYRNGVVKFGANTLLAAIGSSVYYANYGIDVNMVVEAGVSLGDYSASIDYLGLYSAASGEHKAVLSVTTGKDVVSAKVACSTGSASALISAIKDGSVESVEVAGNTTETVTLDINNAGTYSFAVVTYDSSSDQESASTTATISFGGGSTDDSADWNVIGYADYQDGWVIPAFQLTSDGGETYEAANPEDFIYTVQVKESKTTPGVYKVVAPYGDDFPMYSIGLTREDINSTDIIFNAADPTCVIVEPQYSGFSYNPYTQSGYTQYNWGQQYVHNAEGYFYYNGYTETSAIHDACSQLTDFGEEYFSYMEDGVITIPLPMFANATTDYELMYNWKNVYPTIVYLPVDETRSAAPANVKSFAKMKAAQKAKVKAKLAKRNQAVRSVVPANIKFTSPKRKAASVKTKFTNPVSPGKRL
jgi:hypothetical protein